MKRAHKFGKPIFLTWFRVIKTSLPYQCWFKIPVNMTDYNKKKQNVDNN